MIGTNKELVKDNKMIQDLMLADFDFQNAKLMKASALIDKRVCDSVLASLNIFKKFENEFLRIKDANGNEIVLYTRDHMIFVPDCLPIIEVDIIDKTDYCYKDIPVIINLGNKTVNAFLKHDKLIQKTSEIVKCDTREKLMNIDNKLIKRTGNNIFIYDVSSKFKRIGLKLVNANLSLANFHHRSEIVEGLDFVEIIDKYTEVKDFNGKFLVLPNEHLISISTEEQSIKAIGAWIKDKSLSLIVILVCVVILFMVIWVLYMGIIWKCTGLRGNKGSHGIPDERPSNLTAMELLDLNTSTFLNAIEPKPKKKSMFRRGK